MFKCSSQGTVNRTGYPYEVDWAGEGARGSWTPTHDLIWGPRKHLFRHAVTLPLPSKKNDCGAVPYSVHLYIISVSSVERVTRTWRWVMMICKLTHTVSLVLAQSQMISLLLCFALIFFCSLSSLPFSWCLSHTYTYIQRVFFGVVRGMSQSVGYGNFNVSVSKTLFFGCVEKYLYMATHTLSHGLKYIQH